MSPGEAIDGVTEEFLTVAGLSDSSEFRSLSSVYHVRTDDPWVEAVSSDVTSCGEGRRASVPFWDRDGQQKRTYVFDVSGEE